MQAEEHFRAGRLKEALQELTERVRQDPLDSRSRTFFFELLCFAGEYDRAEKQLQVLATSDKGPDLGVVRYRATLAAERTRQKFFDDQLYRDQPAAPPSPPGRLNELPFSRLSDEDPRIGDRLEVLAGDTYLWLRFEFIASIRVEKPKRLRDLIWLPAWIRTMKASPERDLGEVFLPVLSPGSWRHPDDQVRLGRVTVWEGTEDGSEVPFGQKLLLVDGEPLPILELRQLELHFETAALAQ